MKQYKALHQNSELELKSLDGSKSKYVRTVAEVQTRIQSRLNSIKVTLTTSGMGIQQEKPSAISLRQNNFHESPAGVLGSLQHKELQLKKAVDKIGFEDLAGIKSDLISVGDEISGRKNVNSAALSGLGKIGKKRDALKKILEKNNFTLWAGNPELHVHCFWN